MGTNVGYTDPKTLRRNEGPVTSELAARRVRSRQGEIEILARIHSFGVNGCILDDLRPNLGETANISGYSVQSRRTKLHQKGLVLDTGWRRKGESGRLQGIYVTMEAVGEQPNGMDLLQQIRNKAGDRNPFLFGEHEVIPDKPQKRAKVKALVKELLDELISCERNALLEGGCLTSSIGTPYDHEDSAIGRACAYLGIPIPLVAGWGN